MILPAAVRSFGFSPKLQIFNTALLTVQSGLTPYKIADTTVQGTVAPRIIWSGWDDL